MKEDINVKKNWVRNPNKPVKPQPIVKKPIVIDLNCVIIDAEKQNHKWIPDPIGYYVIKVDKKKREIQVGICDYDNINVIKVLIVGKTPESIYKVIARSNLISRLDHAAYLGKELQKALFCLVHNLEYIQD